MKMSGSLYFSLPVLPVLNFAGVLDYTGKGRCHFARCHLKEVVPPILKPLSPIGAKSLGNELAASDNSRSYASYVSLYGGLLLIGLII